MSTPITITTAPCCWGVDDVKNPYLPNWEKRFWTSAIAGFGGLELGPYGYLPLDLGLGFGSVEQARTAYRRHNL